MKRLQFRKIAAAMFSFTKSESKGILLLIPVLIVTGLVISAINRPRIDKSFPLLADLTTDSAARPNMASGSGFVGESDDSDIKPELFQFDPNTIDYRGLRRLGFTRQAAAALIGYRTKYDKIFELPTDFAACYQVKDSIFDLLEPYIVIGERFRPRATKTDKYASRNVDATASGRHTLFEFDPNVIDSSGLRCLGFSGKQAQMIINYRKMTGGFRSVEEFGECYCVADRIEELRPYVVINHIDVVTKKGEVAAEKVELNGADQQALIKVRGIGAVTAERIVEYRTRLGGFYDIRQLSEVEGVTEKNFELFSKEIYVDSSRISKIDINFAPAQIVNSHPYMSGVIARKVLKYKQLEGGLGSITEMINGKILSKAEAEKLSHYLVFTQFTPK